MKKYPGIKCCARWSVPVVAVIAVVLVQPGTGFSWQDEGPLQLTSPLGRPLHAQADEGEAPARIRGALSTAPDSVDLWMRLGISLAGSWRYQQAIDAYSEGLLRDPFNALLYRHRGHRFISTRRFEAAAADLELSSRLDPGNWDTWYHLGLAHYLMGDFDRAEAAYRRCYSITSPEDEGALVAVLDWLWMTLMRMGRQESARLILERIHSGMETGENSVYHRRLLMYKGMIDPGDLIAGDATDINIATSGYGLGNYYLVNGDREKAMEIFRRVVEGPYWPAFGFIAAEAELARIR
jgi:tetratricopeptide (TPR) repeat protein